MNFNFNFEALKGKAMGVANLAKKKTAHLSGIAKANVAIFAEEDKIKKAEAELGRLYYNDYVAGNGADLEAYLPICERITESKNAIQDLKAAIAQLKAQACEEAAINSDEITDADFVVPGEEIAEEPVVIVEEAPEKAAPAEATEETVSNEETAE